MAAHGSNLTSFSLIKKQFIFYPFHTLWPYVYFSL